MESLVDDSDCFFISSVFNQIRNQTLPMSSVSQIKRYKVIAF